VITVDYICLNDKCNWVEERVVEAPASGHQFKCPRCGERMVWKPSFGAVHAFEPYWEECLDEEPVWIENKEQLKQECRKRKVTPACLM